MQTVVKNGCKPSVVPYWYNQTKGKSFKRQSIETQTVVKNDCKRQYVLILGNNEQEDTKMLLRYFEKSKFTECGTIWYNQAKGKSYKRQSIETQTVVNNGCKRQY